MFTSPDVFIDLLKKRFTLSTPSELKSEEDATIWRNRVLLPIRLRVYNVIKTWLENYFNFEQDAGVEKELLDFVNGEMGSAMPGPAKRMIELINKTVSLSSWWAMYSIIKTLFFHLVFIKRISLQRP